MNYSIIEEESEISSAHFLQSQQFMKRNTTLDQLRLMYQISKQGELTFFQSIYAVYFEGIENIELGIEFIRQNQSHNYIEFETANFCGVCLKKRDAHIQNLIDPLNNLIINKAKEFIDLLNSMKYCVVCYELYSKNEFTYINSELHEICEKCFRKYLLMQIQEGRLNQIQCPHCNIQINPQYLAKIDPILYESYIKVQLNQEIMQNPLKAWCPNIHCNNIIEFQTTKKEQTCNQCKTQVCKECKQRAHPQQTCEEFVQQELREWQYDRDTQQCPRCKIIVEKVNGCNHMTCQFCKHEWCWICGSDYSSVHYAIFNPFGCPALMPGWIRQKDWSYTKLLIWRFICFILLLLLTPVFILTIAPIFCIGKLISTQFYKFRSFCTQILLLIIAFIIGLSLIPLCVVLFIIFLIPGIIFVIGLYYQERQRLEQRHKSAMSRHFQNV